MCVAIYRLFVSLSKANHQNQLYLYHLLPYYQIHMKYIPMAVQFLIHLVSNNFNLLLKLSENLKIEFDFDKK